MRISLLLLAMTLCACASSGGRQQVVRWSDPDLVTYRLVAKSDFESKTSNSVWGNVAHGAEICTAIMPARDLLETGRFQAVMKKSCSFWNKTNGATRVGGLLVSAATGLPVPIPVQQPDWYVLQHEQIHFAIMELAALQLSRQVGEIDRSRRTPELVERLLTVTQEYTQARHQEFDSATSGRYDPELLEAWVRLLDVQMREHCGDGCPVRNSLED